MTHTHDSRLSSVNTCPANALLTISDVNTYIPPGNVLDVICHACEAYPIWWTMSDDLSVS